MCCATHMPGVSPVTDRPCICLPPSPAPAAVDYLGGRGYDPAFGARPVKRVVQQELETALAKGELLGGEVLLPLLIGLAVEPVVDGLWSQTRMLWRDLRPRSWLANIVL